MSNSDSLLQGEVSRARCEGKSSVILAFALGLGLGALMAVTFSGGQVTNEPIDMAWQSALAKPSQSMLPAKSLPAMPAIQPQKAFPFMQSSGVSAIPGPSSRTTGFRTQALPNPPALSSGSGLLPKALSLSGGQKCLYANQHASLCGDVVVLRPDIAVRASSGGKGPSTPTVDIDPEEILKDVSNRWDAVENKPGTLLLAGGVVVALYLSNSIIAAVDAIPLLPGLLKTIGLGYTGYFGYRYLLTASSRRELVSDIEELKKKVSGEN